jgi:acetyl esterase/lipase
MCSFIILLIAISIGCLYYFGEELTVGFACSQNWLVHQFRIALPVKPDIVGWRNEMLPLMDIIVLAFEKPLKEALSGFTQNVEVERKRHTFDAKQTKNAQTKTYSIDVLTPKTDEKDLPCLIYIHGG